MKPPFLTPDEKLNLQKFFPTKRAMQAHIRACAAIHEAQWAETRRPVDRPIEPLPFDFIKHSTFGKGTAAKRRIKRQLRRAQSQLSASL